MKLLLATAGLLSTVAYAQDTSQADADVAIPAGQTPATEEQTDAEFVQNAMNDPVMQGVLGTLANLQKAKASGNSTQKAAGKALAGGYPQSAMVDNLSSMEGNYNELEDVLKRFVDLKRLTAWLQPVDKRISRYCYYGCWCLPEGAHGFVSGQGRPVDNVDKACMYLWWCYTCAREDFGDCNPTTRKYARLLTWNNAAPNDYDQRDIVCTNNWRRFNRYSKYNCARAICECDRGLSVRLNKHWTEWSKRRHRIWSEVYGTDQFTVEKDCRWDGSGGSGPEHGFVACGDYEDDGSRWPHRTHGGLKACCNQPVALGVPWKGDMYSTVTEQCCDDGTIIALGDVCSAGGTDVDQCSTGTHECDGLTPDAQAVSDCVNIDDVDGSAGYYCVCNSPFYGLAPDLALHGIRYLCRNINECQPGNESHDCSGPTAFCLDEEPGWSCGCDAGYDTDGQISAFTGNENVCADVDECALTADECNGVGVACSNTVGGYECVCEYGFEPMNDGVDPLNTSGTATCGAVTVFSNNDLTDFAAQQSMSTAQIDSLANHGCWCSATFNNGAAVGTPVDDYDLACQRFQQCNDATSLKGQFKQVCDGSDPDWSLSAVTGACVGTGCPMAKCNCAATFVSEVSDLFANSAVMNTGAVCDNVDNSNVADDAACFDSGAWSFYVQSDQYCTADGITASATLSRVQRFINDAPGVPVADVKHDSDFADDGNSWSPQAGVTCVRRYYWSGVPFAGNAAWKHLVVYCYPDGYVAGTDQVYVIHGHVPSAFDPTFPTYDNRDNQLFAETEVITNGETSNLLDSAVRVALLGKLSVVIYDSPNLPFNFDLLDGSTMNVNPMAYMGSSFAVTAGTMFQVAQQTGGFIPDNYFHDWDVISVMSRTVNRILPLIECNMINDDLLTGPWSIVLAGASKRGWANILLAGSDLQNNIQGTNQIVSDFFDLFNTFDAHHQSLDGFSYAHYEILAAGFTNMFALPQAQEFLNNIDPLRNGVLQYMADKGKQLYITAATADEFILADASHLWWDEVHAIMGNNIAYRMIPNTNHYLVMHEQIPGNTHMHEMGARFAEYAFAGNQFPQISYSFDWNAGGDELTITAVYNEANTGPSHSTIFYSSESLEDTRRDFRIMDGPNFLTYLQAISQGQAASLAPNRAIQWLPDSMSGVTVTENNVGGVVTVEATITKPAGKVIAGFFHFRFSCFFDPTQMCEHSTPVGFAPRDKVGASFTCWQTQTCDPNAVV